MKKTSLILVHVLSFESPLAFAIKLGRETQQCQNEALCVVRNVNQSISLAGFICFMWNRNQQV